MQYVKTLSKVDRERYTRKLQVFYGAVGDSGVRTDPYEILQEKWSASVSSWRPVEFGDMYSYLIKTPDQFTREKLKAHKSLDVFNYYIRHVYNY